MDQSLLAILIVLLLAVLSIGCFVMTAKLFMALLKKVSIIFYGVLYLLGMFFCVLGLLISGTIFYVMVMALWTSLSTNTLDKEQNLKQNMMYQFIIAIPFQLNTKTDVYL